MSSTSSVEGMPERVASPPERVNVESRISSISAENLIIISPLLASHHASMPLSGSGLITMLSISFVQDSMTSADTTGSIYTRYLFIAITLFRR